MIDWPSWNEKSNSNYKSIEFEDDRKTCKLTMWTDDYKNYISVHCFTKICPLTLKQVIELKEWLEEIINEKKS